MVFLNLKRTLVWNLNYNSNKWYEEVFNPFKSAPTNKSLSYNRNRGLQSTVLSPRTRLSRLLCRRIQHSFCFPWINNESVFGSQKWLTIQMFETSDKRGWKKQLNTDVSVGRANPIYHSGVFPRHFPHNKISFRHVTSRYNFILTLSFSRWRKVRRCGSLFLFRH